MGDLHHIIVWKGYKKTEHVMIKSLLRYYKMTEECCVHKIYIKEDVGRKLCRQLCLHNFGQTNLEYMGDFRTALSRMKC